MEIDLLREGESIYCGEQIPPHEYLVHVSRHGDRPRGVLWPILLTQRLPIIKIPLLLHDSDADLDLEQVLNTAYDRAGYDLIVDYKSPPRVALREPNRQLGERSGLESRRLLPARRLPEQHKRLVGFSTLCLPSQAIMATEVPDSKHLLVTGLRAG